MGTPGSASLSVSTSACGAIAVSLVSVAMSPVVLGGNAVVGARYDATEIMQGVTEVLAYGTAVFVEPASRS